MSEDTTMAGVRLMPITPGKSMTTTPGFNKVVLLCCEFCGKQPRRICGNLPHVLFTPSVAGVHNAFLGNLTKNERRQPEPLGWS